MTSTFLGFSLSLRQTHLKTRSEKWRRRLNAATRLKKKACHEIQARPQLVRHYSCARWAFCQPAHCGFDGKAPTAEAVTQSQLTNAQIEPVLPAPINSKWRFYVMKHNLFHRKNSTRRSRWHRLLTYLSRTAGTLCYESMQGHQVRFLLWSLISHRAVNNLMKPLCNKQQHVRWMCLCCVDCLLPLVAVNNKTPWY